MIDSPRYLAIQAATEAASQKTQGRNPVAQAAIHDITQRQEMRDAVGKLREIAATCSRCRTRECVAIWDEFRVCDECLTILTDKYDRQPVEPRGTYTEGFQAGRRYAFGEAAEWVSENLRKGTNSDNGPF